MGAVLVGRGDTLRSRAAWASSRPARVGPRGARCTGAGEGPPVCIRWFQEARPEPRRGLKSLGCRGGAPKGERARSIFEVPRGLGPSARRTGERARAASLVDAARWCASRRSASLLSREEFLGMLSWPGFSWRGKARMRSGIARMDMRMSRKDIFQRTSGYGAATTDAKLSGAAHARTVVDAATARAHRFDPARAVRFVGIVPLLRRQALPAEAHMLRRRPGRLRLEALVPPEEAEAEDAAERMEPARSPQVAVMPRAAKPALPRRSRRGARSALPGWSGNAFAAVARRGHFGLSPPRFVPVAPLRADRAVSFPGQRRCLAP